MSAKNGMVIICPVCGNGKYRSASHIKLGRKFCGHACASKMTRNGFKDNHACYHTEESKKKISEWSKNRVITYETRQKIRATLTGVKHTVERRMNISRSVKGKYMGERHHNWKGGKGDEERHSFMQTIEYKLWRESCAPQNW